MVPLKNRKREAFCREIAASTPYSRAYELAGYGGQPRWWEYNARKLAQQPEVRARIEELQVEFSRMAGLHAAYIQQQLLPLVEANPQDLYHPDGSLRPITELPRALAKAIHKIKLDPETGRVVEISLHNPNEAGSTLLRSLPGGAVSRHEITGIAELSNNELKADILRRVARLGLNISATEREGS
jgi:hypothetical protein